MPKSQPQSEHRSTSGMGAKRPKKSFSQNPLPIPSRRAFSFRSEEGQVHLIKKRLSPFGRKRILIFKPMGSQQIAERALREAQMLNLLAPKNTARARGVVYSTEHYAHNPVGASNSPSIDKWGVAFDVVRPRAASYKRFQEDMYSALSSIIALGLPTSMSRLLKDTRSIASSKDREGFFDEHMGFYERAGKPVYTSLYEKGILMSDNPVNTINSNGVPVLIDNPAHVDAAKLREAAKAMPFFKRRRMMSIIRDWEAIDNELRGTRLTGL